MWMVAGVYLFDLALCRGGLVDFFCFGKLGIYIWGWRGNEAARGVHASCFLICLGEIMWVSCYWWRYLVRVYMPGS